jgi:chemotaxis protein methyltransferase CheR
LLRDFSALGTFDLVFCRNVLIYFDQETKIDVLRRIALSMDPKGFLLLGAAETVVGLTDKFRPHADHRGLYIPSPEAALQQVASNVIPLAPRIAASRV